MIRKMRVTDLLKVGAPEDATQEERDDAARAIRALRRYFRRFAVPATKDAANMITGGLKCLKCSSPLDGYLGTFRWGLAHGEGACSMCGWPARAHHRPRGEDGEEVLSLTNIILQYHPDEVKSK